LWQTLPETANIVLAPGGRARAGGGWPQPALVRLREPISSRRDGPRALFAGPGSRSRVLAFHRRVWRRPCELTAAAGAISYSSSCGKEVVVEAIGNERDRSVARVTRSSARGGRLTRAWTSPGSLQGIALLAGLPLIEWRPPRPRRPSSDCGRRRVRACFDHRGKRTSRRPWRACIERRRLMTSIELMAETGAWDDVLG